MFADPTPKCFGVMLRLEQAEPGQRSKFKHANRLLAVVFVAREQEVMHIINARKATSYEESIYTDYNSA